MDDKIKWRVTWFVCSVAIAFSIGLLVWSQTGQSEAAPKPVDNYKSQVIELAWMSMTGAEQLETCQSWEVAGEDDWRKLLREAGADQASEDGWVAAMHKYC